MFLNSKIFFDFPEKWQCLFQDPATSIAENIIDLHNDIVFFLIVISVFVSWMLFRIVYFFRIGTNTKRTLRLTHHTLLEIVWTLIPTFILIMIALPSYVLIYNMDDLQNPKITVKIIGHQWYWSYEYSDYVNNLNGAGAEDLNFDSYMVKDEDLVFGDLRLLAVDNSIVLPINTSIRLLITASDVIHSWTIPSLGVKMDAVPGRLNQIGTLINRESFFYGQCSELCGINHSFMPIALKATNLVAYFDWLRDKNVTI